jgi:hypothetical protein
MLLLPPALAVGAAAGVLVIGLPGAGVFSVTETRHESRVIGRAAVRGTSMQLIRELERTRDETLRYFSLDQLELSRTYGPGKWPVRFILHHLSDSETVLFDRIRRVLSEPRQVLWVYDQDAWARGLDYARVPIEISRRVYQSVREAIIYHAGIHYEQKGHLEFVHSVTGVRTLKDEFDKVASHNEHHLDQIRSALRGQPGS